MEGHSVTSQAENVGAYLIILLTETSPKNYKQTLAKSKVSMNLLKSIFPQLTNCV